MIQILVDLVKKHAENFLEFWTPTIMITIGVIVFILEAFVGMRAKYGRYNLKGFGLKASLAWLLQESPSFLIPFGLLLYRGPQTSFSNLSQINTNFILLCFFLIHYFNRFLLINMLLFVIQITKIYQ